MWSYTDESSAYNHIEWQYFNMSRKITNYFTSSQPAKKCKVNDNSVKTEDATTVLCDTASAVDHVKSGHMALSSVDHMESEHVTPSSEDLPECWDFNKKNEFCNRYDWLVVKNKKLGCRACKAVGALGPDRKTPGMNISQLWASASITATGEDKSDQMLSLQKKIFKHKESSAHHAALSILETAKTKSLETVCTKAFENEKGVTANIFRTAHKVVKKNQAFYDFEAEIDVQELNGINMGCILHSTNACINIVNHIAVEMKSTVIKNIIEWNNNIALLIDESTTISQLSSLII